MQPVLVLFGTGIATLQAQSEPTTWPTVLSVVPSGYGGLQVTWTEVTDATGYDVRYEQEPDLNVETISGETDVIEHLGRVHTYLVHGLEHDARYLVAVRGYNTVGNGPWSVPVAGGTIPADLPNPPSELALTAGDGSITASWNEADGNGPEVTGYRVEATRDDGLWTIRYEVQGATEKTIDGLTNGTAYSVRVASMNVAGLSPWSEASTATPTAEGGTGDDGADDEAPMETPALPVFGALALGASLLAAGRTRLRRLERRPSIR